MIEFKKQNGNSLRFNDINNKGDLVISIDNPEVGLLGKRIKKDAAIAIINHLAKEFKLSQFNLDIPTI